MGVLFQPFLCYPEHPCKSLALMNGALRACLHAGMASGASLRFYDVDMSVIERALDSRDREDVLLACCNAATTNLAFCRVNVELVCFYMEPGQKLLS